MKNTIFTGAATAIVTPFQQDGTIDYNALANNIEYQIQHGIDAIVVCGTTGESATLSDEEHISSIRFTVEQTKHRVPVIAGTGSNDTAYAVHLSQEAEKLGADALLLVTPYYNKTSQRGLVAHFNAIADAVNVPMILYNVPSRTGMSIDVDTMFELAKHKNIVALKEATGNMSYAAKLLSVCGDVIDVYSGNDDLIVPMMSIGSKGVISVLSNILPQETHDMCQLCLDNNFAAAAKMQLEYMELINALFCETNPIPVKEAMNLMGMPAGGYRLPLYQMSEAHLAMMIEILKKNRLIPQI